MGAKSKIMVSSSPNSRRTVSKIPRQMKEKEDFSWVEECLIIKPCILHPRPKFVRPKIKYPKFGLSKCIVSVQKVFGMACRIACFRDTRSDAVCLLHV